MAAMAEEATAVAAAPAVAAAACVSAMPVGCVLGSAVVADSALVSEVRPELGEDLAAALVAAVHGPRAVWGGLWWASGSALCARMLDAVVD